MSDNVRVTIDGLEVSVPAGTLVIRAAEQAGKYIPRFCDHPLLDPLGACRQCLVEIEGQRKPLTACTTTVMDGMIVRTDSTLARDAQSGVLELLLINHPLDCPMCDKGGECPLQDQALAYGPGGSRYIDQKRRFVKPVTISPLVKLDRERCVLCARCTRFSDQIAGDPFIELFERGALEQVAIFEDEPYQSVFSGNVVQICPVGALTATPFRFRARPFDMTSTDSTCNRCASGCAIEVQERRGQLVRVLARENLDLNDEWICDKGRFGYAYASLPERITEPLVRKGDEFVAVSWSEAVDVVADAVRAARAAGKPSAVLGGAQLYDEDSYALSRFARSVLRTNDVDFRMREGTEEEERVLTALPKLQGATYKDIDAASTIVVAGIDLQQESPIVFLRVRKALRRGATVIEVGPRASALTGSGARWISCAPGEEAAAIAALDASVVLVGERLVFSEGALTAAWNLGARFGWIPRKAGARGAAWAGLHPALLPGGRSVRWAPQRAQTEEIWGVPVPENVGRDARAILTASSELGVLVLAGTDPARDFTDPALGAHACATAEFVVALDMFATDSVARAHVVLPVASAYERNGTLTNWEGRAQTVNGTVPAPGLTQPDWEILRQIADALDAGFPQTIEALRREMREFAPAPHDAEAMPSHERPSQPRAGLTLVSVPQLLDAGTMMSGATELALSARDTVIEMNPADADGVDDGHHVRVETARGAIEGLARLSERVARGAVVVTGVARGYETVTVDKI